jgi:hypothetical protein
MAKAAPAMRRASEESLPSAKSARARAIALPEAVAQESRQRERGARSEPIDATTTSAPPMAGQCGGFSKEPLRLGWAKLTIGWEFARLSRAITHQVRQHPPSIALVPAQAESSPGSPLELTPDLIAGRDERLEHDDFKLVPQR